MPGADGWYINTLWYPDLQLPGSLKFVQDYKAMFGTIPQATTVYYVMSLGAAIQAIKQAGTTDREKIAQVARSGQLYWEDSPMGPFRWGTDGLPSVTGFIAQVQQGALVGVEEIK